MKKIFILLLALSLPLLAGNNARFMKYPDINKEKIIFSYEGDLWETNISGGTAIRLTKHPGSELLAKYSPDGKYIAFSGNYDGPQSVYLMPSNGGEIKRLTYTPGPSQCVAWTPDNKNIIFRSMMDVFISRDPNLYSVSIDGSAPEQLPIDRGRLCSFSADGKKMLYTRKGDEEYYWKRYKGGRYVDIWMYDFTTKNFTPISDYVGKNAYPMWIGNKMYFTSDRDKNGITNIFVQDLTSKEITQVTKYDDFDVMFPSTDGNNIVYIQNGYLHVLDVKDHSIKKINVTVNTDNYQLYARYINPKDYIQSISIANDVNKVAIEARGDIFIIDNNEGTKNLSQTSGTRERYPQISPDGKWVAFYSDKSDQYQIYMQKIEGGQWIQLTTTLDRTCYKLLWSPDGKKILFGNKDFAIFYVDVETKKITEVDRSNQLKNDEFYWEIADYDWSPDSKWLCYSFVQYNRNSQIFIYNIEQNKKYAITDDFFDNLNPSFDKNGEYLYYISSGNFRVQMDFYEDNHIIPNPQQIMAVQLKAGEQPPFMEKVIEKTKNEKGFRIDIENIKNRIYPLPVPSGNYFSLKAGNGKVAWLSLDKFTDNEFDEIFKPAGETKWDLHIFSMDKKKDITISEKVSRYTISTNGDNILIMSKDVLCFSEINKSYDSKALGTKLDVSKMVYLVEPLKEWHQIFNDAWRFYREFFYDANMHGLDWNKSKEKYLAYIPDLTSRDDLNWVLQQMVGELCVSHTYVNGGDFNQPTSQPSIVYTGWLGADLVADKNNGYYKFSKIYGPTPQNYNISSPLVRPDINIKEGYYLIAINGKDIKVPEDYWKHLQISQGTKTKVTINDKPTSVGAITYEIELIQNNSNLRYFRWISDNIDKITKATNGHVGYMHINAMNSAGIGEFDKYWRAYRYKDGIIIDMRRNSGGWTEYFLIDKLERKVVGFNVLKDVVPFRYPGTASNGNYVALSNEYNGSDGEAFISHFKNRNLGKVIGVPSWGGLVGIVNGQPTIDNGTIHQPNNAFYGKEGKWWVENHGADPDIFLDNDPKSVMEGKDLQLEKAIEVILENAKTIKLDFPGIPPYPKP
jgi:tricorn protease